MPSSSGSPLYLTESSFIGVQKEKRREEKRREEKRREEKREERREKREERREKREERRGEKDREAKILSQVPSPQPARSQ